MFRICDEFYRFAFQNKNIMSVRLAKEVLLLTKPGESEPVKVSYDVLRRAVLTLRAVNHKLRKEIIALLETNGKLTVTDLYVKLRLEQSVASQHLAILRKANIVETEREGKFIYYKLNKDRIFELSRLAEEMAS
jgi:DNA-binding transcriptional ArsR family regulator